MLDVVDNHELPLDRAAKRARIAEALRARPDDSNRKIAADLGVSDKTVGAVRADMADENPQVGVGAENDIPHEFDDHEQRNVLHTAGLLLTHEADATSDVSLLRAGQALLAQSRGQSIASVDDGGFNWDPEDRDVIVPAQPAIAVYKNAWDQAVIRSEALDSHRDEDQIVRISVEHIPAVIRALAALYAESTGKALP